MTDDVADVTKMRLVADRMDDMFSRMFKAFPDRVIFIRDGKIAYTGRTIMQQMKDTTHLMTHEARDWLAENVGPANTYYKRYAKSVLARFWSIIKMKKRN